MKGNRSPVEVSARKLDAGAAVMILAFGAICAATVLAEGRLFRVFFAIAGAYGLGVAAFLQIRERISGSLAGAEIQDDLRHPIVSGHTIRDVGGAFFAVASIAALIAGMPTVW